MVVGWMSSPLLILHSPLPTCNCVFFPKHRLMAWALMGLCVQSWKVDVWSQKASGFSFVLALTQTAVFQVDKEPERWTQPLKVDALSYCVEGVGVELLRYVWVRFCKSLLTYRAELDLLISLLSGETSDPECKHTMCELGKRHEIFILIWKINCKNTDMSNFTLMHLNILVRDSILKGFFVKLFILKSIPWLWLPAERFKWIMISSFFVCENGTSVLRTTVSLT